jgi:hypothetical protein
MNLKTKPLILAFLFTVSIQVIGFAQGKFIADNQAINRNIFADKQLEISVCDTKNKLMDLHSYIFSKGIFENKPGLIVFWTQTARAFDLL